MTDKTPVKKKTKKAPAKTKQSSTPVNDTPVKQTPVEETTKDETSTVIQETTELIEETTKAVEESELKEDSMISSFNTQINRMEMLEKECRQAKYDLKKMLKLYEKKVKSKKRKVDPNREPSGFAKPALLSDALCKFLKLPKGSKMARTEVTQKVNEYIKEKKLQNPENKKNITPDKVLVSLLNITDKDTLTYFSMQKYLKDHFPKEDTTVVV